METEVFLARRFDRLRQIIQLRNDKIQQLDKQVLVYFEEGNLQGIEALMRQKTTILSTNEQLCCFIDKWESRASSRIDEQLYTSI
ncbi:hypothetical protein [Ammoniphilus sp. CFH 90114]|uniref:hypothetical protein n=1 Tax=Ammoniphilus sp. CFH 90114 TaxID=2493665 RepID=UPI00100DBE50|nr:hypothetical protein [Ammoniphilus sp. CFH 90114]RXT13605.1 hypothetical protein EIZ39_05495 [Ammoniphilus sp. CFH 90114]